MSEGSTFADFLRRVRDGDDEAAEQLVRQYEAAIRLEVRMNLSDSRLRRRFDSMDVCQSVLGSFFARAALGQYDLNDPGQLLRLLVVMARNKLRDQVRKERRQKRDHRAVEGAVDEGMDVAGDAPSPSRFLAGKELLAAVRARLNDEERQIADRRCQGQSWEEVARAMGGTAEARRKQFDRAVDRVSQELGLDEADDE
jgi:RNA polymerase sigma-70 factor (ECF subfamily)